MTKSFMWICLSVMFLCFGGSLVYLSFKLPLVLDQRLQSMERVVDARAQEATIRVEMQLSETRGILDRVGTRLTADANANTQRFLNVFDSRLSEVTGPAGVSVAAVGNAVEHLSGIREDIKPMITEVNSLSGPLLRNALGVVAATKVTMGETAWTMKEIRGAAEEIRLATPEMIATLNRVAANSDKATAATAGAMLNLQELTKPLPRWLRVFMQVGVPVGPYVLAGIAR